MTLLLGAFYHHLGRHLFSPEQRLYTFFWLISDENYQQQKSCANCARISSFYMSLSKSIVCVYCANQGGRGAYLLFECILPTSCGRVLCQRWHFEVRRKLMHYVTMRCSMYSKYILYVCIFLSIRNLKGHWKEHVFVYVSPALSHHTF